MPKVKIELAKMTKIFMADVFIAKQDRYLDLWKCHNLNINDFIVNIGIWPKRLLFITLLSLKKTHTQKKDIIYKSPPL